MVALKIDDVKDFTTKLFVGTDFDAFLVREANIVTFNTFTIDGHVRRGYYSEDDLEANKIEELSAWPVLKPVCFSLIKGKKLPGSFKITLQLPPEEVQSFLSARRLAVEPGQVNGIYLNIRYEDHNLYCISGTSLNVFTLDKALEAEWDEAVRRFLHEHEIAFEEK